MNPAWIVANQEALTELFARMLVVLSAGLVEMQLVAHEGEDRRASRRGYLLARSDVARKTGGGAPPW